MARQKGIEPIALGEKIQQKAEKYAAGLRFGSVLISGLFLSVLFIGTRRYYVEHLIFSLHYYSFDFFCKSIFAVAFIVSGALGFKLPTLALGFILSCGFYLPDVCPAQSLPANLGHHGDEGSGVVCVRDATVHCRQHGRIPHRFHTRVNERLGRLPCGKALPFRSGPLILRLRLGGIASQISRLNR